MSITLKIVAAFVAGFVLSALLCWAVKTEPAVLLDTEASGTFTQPEVLGTLAMGVNPDGDTATINVDLIGRVKAVCYALNAKGEWTPLVQP